MDIEELTLGQAAKAYPYIKGLLGRHG